MFLKVATVNDTPCQVRFVYIVFGYNFNMSKDVSHSFAVKTFRGQMSDTLGSLWRNEIIKIATSIGTYKNYTIYAASNLKAKCKIRKSQ